MGGREFQGPHSLYEPMCRLQKIGKQISTRFLLIGTYNVSYCCHMLKSQGLLQFLDQLSLLQHIIQV